MTLSDVLVFSTDPNNEVSAGASGDPYVETFLPGPKYKIPGICANFRLFSYRDIVVNASVAGLNIDEQNTLINCSGRFKNGHYFYEFSIQRGKEFVTYDRYLNLKSQNTYSKLHIVHSDDRWNDMNCEIQGKQRYKTINLLMNSVDPGVKSGSNYIRVELQKFESPEVLNGIRVFLGNPNMVSTVGGILNSRAKPNHFIIKPRKNTNMYIEQPLTSDLQKIVTDNWQDKWMLPI